MRISELEDIVFNEQRQLLTQLVKNPLILLMDVNYRIFLAVNREQVVLVMNKPPIFDDQVS